MKKIAIGLLFFSFFFLVGCAEKEEDVSMEAKIKIPEKPSSKLKDSQKESYSKETSKKSSKSSKTKTYSEAPNPDDVMKAKKAVLKTNLGDITVEFFTEDSPQTVANFVKLAQDGFYKGIKFHRVIEDFMIQCGDPNSISGDKSTWGRGGPGYKFEDEFNDHLLVRGSLAMANSGPDTNGSQFFIVTADATSWLDGKHTNFGQVTEGMDVVEKIEKVEKDSSDRPIKDVVIEKVEVE